jgi:hypothetical protein
VNVARQWRYDASRRLVSWSISQTRHGRRLRRHVAPIVALVIVPNIKYPANPPSVGEPDTIGYRTGLFFLMIAIPVATMVFSVSVRRHLLAKLGQWNASIVAGLVFVAIIAAVQSGLPSVSELPAGFPAAWLW